MASKDEPPAAWFISPAQSGNRDTQIRTEIFPLPKSGAIAKLGDVPETLFRGLAPLQSLPPDTSRNNADFPGYQPGLYNLAQVDRSTSSVGGTSTPHHASEGLGRR